MFSRQACSLIGTVPHFGIKVVADSLAVTKGGARGEKEVSHVYIQQTPSGECTGQHCGQAASEE